jgi:hypothetical protein
VLQPAESIANSFLRVKETNQQEGFLKALLIFESIFFVTEFEPPVSATSP